MTELLELVEVVFVNLVLSADNAIVVGIAVAGLPVAHRFRVMALGIAGATLLRIVFAAFTVQLLEIVGLLLVGGLLLLWICWKLWSELRSGKLSADAATSDHPKTMREAVWQIVVADVSMSLDKRARGRRRRARASLGAGCRARAVDRVHGTRGPR
jgi:YjbE family integral membrane protein